MKIIDLRSDTVTRPSEEMRKAMYNAELGDDVYKEDPTVNELEAYAADLLGKEAALFVSSGVMGNQLCLHVMSNRYDEVICEKDAHIFYYESGSPAALSGLQLMPIEGDYGVMDPLKVEEAIRPKDAYYMPTTRIIAVENSHNRAGGAVVPISNLLALKEVAHKNGLVFHLDGARVWNAAVALGIAPREITSLFDTVSCCLSKGLGAPIGTVIAGSKEMIKNAFRIRKAWGGGTRQAGVLAAAGLYALKNNIERLAEDHENAKIIANAFAETGKFELNLQKVETNIVAIKPLTNTVDEVIAILKEKGVLVSGGKIGHFRAVTHLDVSKEMANEAAEIIKKSF